MLNDTVLERIFINREMQKIPLGCQSAAVIVFQTVLEEIAKEDKYATVQSLLTTDV
jgi:hypothetical protein